jgi:DNA-binding HxlR family transcriptional regulator
MKTFDADGEVILMSELCPRFEKAMQIISKRWVGLILFELLDGPKRFSEMESNLPISGRLLSDRLKMLEKEGIVDRNIYSEFPVRIEYSLSQKGESLRPVIEDIQSWANEWIPKDEIEEA